MMKYVCDLCLKEITKTSVWIDYRGTYAYDNKMYCMDCFSKKTNWKTIHADIIRKEEEKIEQMRKRLHLSSRKF